MKAIPSRLFRAEQVREFDRRAIEDQGIPGYELMTRAGRAAWHLASEMFPSARRWLVVCGAGNNAGDGYVVARLAQAAGRHPVVRWLKDPESLCGDAHTAWAAYRDAGGEAAAWDGASVPDRCDLIVDALLGTGLDRPVSGPWADAVAAVNDAGRPVVALDVPSGLNADTGAEMGAAVRADLTVTFVGMKLGLLTGRGPALCGRVRFAGLAIPPAALAMEPAAHRLREDALNRVLPKRVRDGHKGRYGHALVVGGGEGMGGAPRLAAEAALRSGAGLVSVATVPEHVAPLLASCPEVMTRGVSNGGDLDPMLKRATLVALGPGLGQTDWSRKMFTRALASGRPLVLDADGLNLLADNPLRRDDWVLTPHPGEAARLLGATVGEVEADRPGAVRALQDRYGGVVILKGAGTLVCDGEGPLSLCDRGNPGMATAGMGDVLTGIVAGLAVQSGRLAEAAAFGVLVHALAGDRAAADAERGLMARDLIGMLRSVVNPAAGD
jgi:NAD(P)H-hydrate epimerase